jgi:hypothetical protein
MENDESVSEYTPVLLTPLKEYGHMRIDPALEKIISEVDVHLVALVEQGRRIEDETKEAFHDRDSWMLFLFGVSFTLSLVSLVLSWG